MKRAAVSICLSVMVTGLGFAQSSIRVVDAETGTGVESEIYHKSDSGSRRRVGVTKTDGRLSPVKSGKRGEQYLAVNEAYNLTEVECPLSSEQVIRLRKTRFVSEYVIKAEFFAAVDKPAAAALQYQLAAGVSKANRTTEGPAYKAIENFAEALEVENPFEAGHRPGVVKPTPSFAGAVADFQSKSGLSPTGKLDQSTLKQAVLKEEKGQDLRW